MNMAEGKVGYKNPPKEFQFKPKNRANPYGAAGRKKANFLEITQRIDNTAVNYQQNGQPKTERRIALTIRQLARKASAGDIDAADLLIRMRQRAKEIDIADQTIIWLDERDALA
jgi:hypothetical protein